MKNDRFVPLEKRSRKQQREHFSSRRGDWNGVTPVTRVLPDRKKYDRSREKSRIRTELL